MISLMQTSENHFLKTCVDPGTRRFLKYLQYAVDIYIFVRIYGFFFTFLDGSLIFEDTIITGGDTASWHAILSYLKNTLLPAHRLISWDPGNFCGYPLFQFYFPLPFLLAAILGYFMPLTIGLKIVTLLGSVCLPLTTYFAFRKLRYRFPLPAIAATLSLVFLFQGEYTMFGGNLKSTFAGEFCYSISLMLFVYYLASIYEGLTNGKGLLLTSILLALIGLTHTFVFMSALLLPLFFTFDRKRLVPNMNYALRLNVLAFLLMAFWAIPLMATKNYMPPFDLIWVFYKTSEFLLPFVHIFATAFVARALLAASDKALAHVAVAINGRKTVFCSIALPAVVIAGFFVWRLLWQGISWVTICLFAVPIIVFFVKLSFLMRKNFFLKPEHPRHFRYFCFVGLVGILLYLNAHMLGVPDIRFLPVVILMAIFVSVDFLGYLMGFIQSVIGQQRSMNSIACHFATFIALTVLALFCAEETFKFARHIGKETADWFVGNYAGYEAKPHWKEFKRINDYLKGNCSDARVAYEKTPFYGKYGGDRVFESLPYFSGRSTLEGVHFSSSIMAKPIMSFQTEFSKHIMTPIPYIFSRINVAALPSHFEMFNISQIIAVSHQVKTDLREHPGFVEEFKEGKVSIFRYNGKSDYVSVAKNYPVIYDGPDWKEAFYLWFKQLNTNDIPIVPADFARNSSSDEVFSERIHSLSELHNCRKGTGHIDPSGITVKLTPFRIKFHTDYPGLPHIVKVSYFPAWKVSGAKKIYPVSPGFMMIVPDSSDVELYYCATFWDRLGNLLSICGLLIIIYCAVLRRQPLGKLRFLSARKLEKFLMQYHRPLMYVFLVLLSVSTVYCLCARNRPVKVYQAGAKLYTQKHYKEAVEVFREVVDDPSIDRVDRILCMLFSARAYDALKENEKAIDILNRLIDQYPNSRYAGESYYELGRIYRNAGKDEKARMMFKKSLTTDKHSSYAIHAGNALRNYGED